MHEAGHPKLVLWDNPEGWGGEGGGRGAQDGHMHTHGWFMLMYGIKPPQYCKDFLQYCKISLQLK